MPALVPKKLVFTLQVNLLSSALSPTPLYSEQEIGNKCKLSVKERKPSGVDSISYSMVVTVSDKDGTLVTYHSQNYNVMCMDVCLSSV